MILLKRVSFLDKLMFTKHLAIMIKSGVPIFEAVESLAANSESEYFKFVLRDVLVGVENGKSLCDALKKYPKIFDDFYTSLIKVSEDSGTLEETLEFLSEQLAKDYALRKKIQGAMFYPAIIMATGVGIAGFISLFILPQLVGFFTSLDIELPLPTKILLFIANIMKDHGILIFGGGAVFFIFLRWFVNTKLFKPIWHKMLLRIPIFGKLLKYGQLARFCRNLATLVKSGVPIAEGLRTASNTMSNVVYRSYLLVVREDLLKGKSISISLQERKFSEIPPMLTKMIGVGEKTGNLEEVLLYLSEFYEQEVDDLAKNLTTMLEPILLVGIGGMVAFIALAIIGPIYKVTSNF
ncbi:MAG: hypothetical protein QG570_158 [Patescibacteria group bacterium]|nr:hypothetical protein [Patescibacteria group bacterium]